GTIAGLQLDEAAPGWKHFVVRPQPGGGLTAARATFDSPHGLVVSDWSLAGSDFSLTVTVPVNASATVYVPYTHGVLRDGGDPGPAGSDGGYALGSGTWLFTAHTM